MIVTDSTIVGRHVASAGAWYPGPRLVQFIDAYFNIIQGQTKIFMSQ